MKLRTLFFCGALTSLFWAACNCGVQPGAPCRTPSDCGPGLTCTDGVCTDPNAPKDGGGDRTDGGDQPDGGNPDGGCVNLQCRQVTCSDGSTTTLTGKIYDPSGTVPLYNAVVYVPNGDIQPFPSGVSCDQCGALTTGSPLVITLTGPDGAFELKNVPVGPNIPLVFQIGRWRRKVILPSVEACKTTPLTDVNILRMPRNKSEGDIPQMAIASGDADPFECLLLKMGISPSEFTRPTGDGRVHYFVQNGYPLDGGAPAANTLWGDAGTLLKYDVVMLPCEGGENRKPAYATQNIINYTSQGGRVFTTHYGYVWTEYAQEPFTSTADWRPGLTNPPDPFRVNIDQSFPKGQAFAQWLKNVGASADAGVLDLIEARHNVVATYPGKSTRWMYATNPNNSNTSAVPHLTFNTPVNPPALPDGGTAPQCGRVVFSDFHVSADARNAYETFPEECRLDVGLTPQEKALVFMLYDLASCIQKDDSAPSVCIGLGQSCSNGGTCCSGLTCLNQSGSACNGAANCTCNVIIR